MSEGRERKKRNAQSFVLRKINGLCPVKKGQNNVGFRVLVAAMKVQASQNLERKKKTDVVNMNELK